MEAVRTRSGKNILIHSEIAPAVDGVPVFTREELAWLKAHQPTLPSDAFDLICDAKINAPCCAIEAGQELILLRAKLALEPKEERPWEDLGFSQSQPAEEPTASRTEQPRPEKKGAQTGGRLDREEIARHARNIRETIEATKIRGVKEDAKL